jgi:hypothetical protein
MWNIGARYQNCAQWILAHNAKVVRASCRRDEEEMHSRYRCAGKAFYLVILLCTININVQVEV